MRVREAGTVRRAGLRIAAFTAIALASVGATSQDGFGPRQMPAIGLRTTDAIDHLDFAVEGERAIDIAWITTRRSHADRDKEKTEVWFRRLEPTSGAWSEPVLVAPGGHAPLRIITVGSELHIFFGHRLQHFVSLNRGVLWREETPVAAGQFVESFDTGVCHDGILVAYLADMPYVANRAESSVVWTAQIRGDQALKRVQISTALGVVHCPPKLLTSGSSVHLFYAVSRVGRGPEPDRIDSQLYHTELASPGGSWTPPQTIATLGLLQDRARAAGNGSIASIDAVRIGRRFLVFYVAGYLYVTASQNGEAWSRPSTLIGARTRVGPAQTHSVAAATNGAGGQLLWIDERFQHTDRSLLNPWGLPDFLNADWSNNDVLALPMSAVTRTPIDTLALKPTRLTRDLSYARQLRARAGGAHIYALWAGRVKVGKRPESFGKPPTIFYQTLEPE